MIWIISIPPAVAGFSVSKIRGQGPVVEFGETLGCGPPTVAEPGVRPRRQVEQRHAPGQDTRGHRPECDAQSLLAVPLVLLDGRGALRVPQRGDRATRPPRRQGSIR